MHSFQNCTYAFQVFLNREMLIWSLAVCVPAVHSWLWQLRTPLRTGTLCTDSLFSCIILLVKFSGFSVYHLFGFVLQSNPIVQKGRCSFFLIKSETVAKCGPRCERFSPQVARSGDTSGDRLQQEIGAILAFHLQHPRWGTAASEGFLSLLSGFPPVLPLRRTAVHRPLLALLGLMM